MCAADFRTACKKAGLALIVIFAARCVADAVTALIGALMADCDAQITSSVQALANILILYVLAIAVTSKLLGYHFDGSLYKKPKRLGKAISWFVPMYGAGQAANIAVMAISFFIVQNRSAVEDTLTPIVSSGTGRGAWYLAFLFIQMAVLAPVFEEYWFRGVIQSSLAPYGNGFAILVSSLCFGMAHGNIHQFCYTVIVGICLGYVRYATGSLVPTMIMHAIFNSIAGIAIVAVSSETFISAFTHIQQGEGLTGVYDSADDLPCCYTDNSCSRHSGGDRKAKEQSPLPTGKQLSRTYQKAETHRCCKRTFVYCGIYFVHGVYNSYDDYLTKGLC